MENNALLNEHVKDYFMINGNNTLLNKWAR
jgi:hypothetical protein